MTTMIEPLSALTMLDTPAAPSQMTGMDNSCNDSTYDAAPRTSLHKSDRRHQRGFVFEMDGAYDCKHSASLSSIETLPTMRCSLSSESSDADYYCSFEDPKQVRFAPMVEIREMPTTLGVGPVAIGPPLTMQWEPSREYTAVLNDSSRSLLRRRSSVLCSMTTSLLNNRRNALQPLTPQQRHVRLRQNGITVQEIQSAIAVSQLILQQRMKTQMKMMQRQQKRSQKSRRQRRQSHPAVVDAMTRKDIFLECA